MIRRFGWLFLLTGICTGCNHSVFYSPKTNKHRTHTKIIGQEGFLNGKVKNLTEQIFYAISLDNGNFEQGKPSPEDIFLSESYDLYGNLLEQKQLTANDSLIAHKKYSYDPKARFVRVSNYTEKGLVGYCVRNFDKDGLLVEKLRYDERGELFEKEFFHYNDRRLLVRCEHNRLSQQDGRWHYSQTKYMYSAEGRLIEQLDMEEGERIISKTMNQYDDEGNKVKSEFESHEQGIRVTNVYKTNYDEKRQRQTRKEVTCTQKGKVDIFCNTVISITDFDSLKRVVRTQEGDFEQIFQEFDNQGNWTKCLRRNPVGGDKILIRTLEYYNQEKGQKADGGQMRGKYQY